MLNGVTAHLAVTREPRGLPPDRRDAMLDGVTLDNFFDDILNLRCQGHRAGRGNQLPGRARRRVRIGGRPSMNNQLKDVGSRAVRKAFLRLLPLLFIAYLASFLNRVNIVSR